ncbi:MAG: hypothetical protein ACHP9Z_31850 [Streptosporangiales bacterium]
MNSDQRVYHPTFGPRAQPPAAARLTSAAREAWARASLQALPVTVFVLALFYYWFAVADRYRVFLYGHFGATPFSAGTVSRYWMAGLVAAGGVLLADTAVNGLAGWLARWRGRRYAAPDWRRVWALCALPVAAGILAITLSCNQPTLPLPLAAACAAAALGGLALALPPGALAARRPTEVLWLGLYGAGLTPPLLWLRALELPGQKLASPLTAALLAGAGLLGGGLWLAGVSSLRAWRRAAPLPARRVFFAGLAVTYLVLPAAHYALLTPPQYPYISVAANFFALTPVGQAASLAVTAGLAAGAARLEGWLQKRTTRPGCGPAGGANPRPNNPEDHNERREILLAGLCPAEPGRGRGRVRHEPFGLGRRSAGPIGPGRAVPRSLQPAD